MWVWSEGGAVVVTVSPVELDLVVGSLVCLEYLYYEASLMWI